MPRHLDVFNIEQLYGHCSDGWLVYDGPSITFVDTYWGILDSQSKRYSLEYFAYKLKLDWGKHYVCNLHEVSQISKYNVPYYNPCDVYCIPEQHGCYRKYYLRDGAEPDRKTIKDRIIKAIDKTEFQIVNLEKKLEELRTHLNKCSEYTDKELFYIAGLEREDK